MQSLSPTEFWTLVSGFAASLITNIFLLVQKHLDRKSSAEVNAYNQLSELFKDLRVQLHSREDKDKERDSEFDALEAKFDLICEKARQARFDLLDLRQGLNEIERFIKAHNVKDEKFLQSVETFKAELKRIGDSLR